MAGWAVFMVLWALYPSRNPEVLGLRSGAYEQLFAAIFGAVLGLALGFVEGVNTGSQKQLVRACAAFTGAGAVGGLVGIYLGQMAMGLIGGSIPRSDLGLLAFLRMLLARTLAWGLWGVVAGVGLGIALGAITGSTRRLQLAAAGGALGGLLGGFLFQLLGVLGPLMSYPVQTLVSFTCIAVAIAFLQALAQEMFKQAWVRVLVGRGEGREFQIAKPTTVIGRDELADIPLFGDQQIAKRHVLIQQAQGRHTAVAAAPGLAFAVNGQMLASAPLKDGDLIRISSRELEFHEKASRQYSPATAQQFQQPPPSYGPAVDIAPGACPFCGQTKDAYGNCGCTVGTAQPTPQAAGQAAAPQTGAQMFGQSPGFAAGGGPGFAIIAGPAAGRRITLAEGQSAGIGRSPDADIAVEADTFMSRRHAHISVQGGAAVVQDDGSANGTFVNGSRVTQQALRPGDIISVGQTQIRVE